MNRLIRALASAAIAFTVAFLIIVFAQKYPLTLFVLGIVGIGIVSNIWDR